MNVTPERWQQVARIYQLAVDHDPATRDAFLSRVCAGDDSLLHEVQSLLCQDDAPVVIDRPVWATAAGLFQIVSDLGPGATLGPYRIDGLLGAGGMGEVFSATDTRLNRRVALKVILGGVVIDRRLRARFAREAEAVAALTHPHICTLYDVGRHHEIDFLVMEHLEGETLAARLAHGPLPFELALTYAKEIASALDHAHCHGIIHRDLKPANIMLTAGGAKLLDFGLAKFRTARGHGAADVDDAGGSIVARPSAQMALEQSATDHAHLTGGGAILGTARYMAPERITGNEVDARSDLFSFGAVLYEMFTGRRAFEGDTAATIRDAILDRQPLPVSSHHPLVPPAIDEIVRRCLAKNRDERWPTAGDILRELEQTGRATSNDDRASIVVLPFVNLNADPENELVTDGLTEELIGTLASVAGLKVVARTSAFHFKGRTDDIRKIGQDLGVRTALEGSVRIHNQRIRVTSQLIDLSNGLHLWSEIFDRTLGGIFDIQEEIAQAIVDALRVRLAPGERARLRRRAPQSAEAHEHYLKGKHFWHKNTPWDAKKSVHHLERAVALDPAYGAAHAGLADAYLLLLSHQAEAPDVFVPKARRAAENALRLEDSAEAHSSMGMVLAVGEWNWTAAEREFRRALHLKPSFSYIRMGYAVTCLCPMGRHSEAVAELRKSVALDPLSIFTRIMLGQTLVLGADGESAVDELRQALDLEPGHVFGHITLALAYLSQARHRDAADVLDALGEPGRAFPNCLGHLGYARGILGDRAEAERILETLLDRFSGCWVPSVDVAAIHNGLGDTDAALEWLARAHRDRSFDSLFVIDDPRFVNLRSNSRFIELFARRDV